MAITGTDRGTGNDAVAGTSFALSPGGNFASGSWAVLCVAADNAGSNGSAFPAFSVADSLGNTWTRRASPLSDPGGALAGVEGAIFTTSMDGGTLTTGTVVTVSFGATSVPTKAWALMEVVPSGGATLSFVTAASGAPTTNSTPTVTTSAITSGNMLVAGVFTEADGAPVVQDGDSSSGAWSAQQTASSGAGTSNVAVASQRKVVTSTAAQTYNPTLDSSADAVCAWIEITETLAAVRPLQSRFARGRRTPHDARAQRVGAPGEPPAPVDDDASLHAPTFVRGMRSEHTPRTQLHPPRRPNAVSYRPTASSDDAYQDETAGTTTTNTSALLLGAFSPNNQVGIRFPGVSGLGGREILSATLHLHSVVGASGSGVVTRVRAQDAAGPGAFSSGPGFNVSSRSYRAVEAAATFPLVGSGDPAREFQVDVTALIQDLVAAHDPTAILLQIDYLSGGTWQIVSFDGHSGIGGVYANRHAQLDIVAGDVLPPSSVPFYVPTFVKGMRSQHRARTARIEQALQLTGEDLPVTAFSVAPMIFRGRARPPKHKGTARLGRPAPDFVAQDLRIAPRVHALTRHVRAEPHVVLTAPHLIDWARRTHAARGLYRVFNAAVYRFYRSNAGPPAEGSVPFATNATLPHEPASTFADGTWWLSVSYFNGVLDSGFLPLGEDGSTAVKIIVLAGASSGTPPRAPVDVRLDRRAGGVVRVAALYYETGGDRAEMWAIGYTVDGSTPAEDTPTTTQAFRHDEGPEILVFDLPAQAHGTTVKVRVQVRRGVSTYSDDSTVLTTTADAQGPAAPDVLTSWPGPLPEGV